MRFLTADYLYPLNIPPIKEGVLQISDLGEVLAIFNNRCEVPENKMPLSVGGFHRSTQIFWKGCGQEKRSALIFS